MSPEFAVLGCLVQLASSQDLTNTAQNQPNVTLAVRTYNISAGLYAGNNNGNSSARGVGNSGGGGGGGDLSWLGSPSIASTSLQPATRHVTLPDPELSTDDMRYFVASHGGSRDLSILEEPQVLSDTVLDRQSG